MSALFALAFAAGMLAPVNPCGFALLPAWIAHTLPDAERSLPRRLGGALVSGTGLTVGFAGTLVTAGLAISAGARALIGLAPVLGLLVGLGLLGLGLVMLGTGHGPRLRLRLPGVSAGGRGGPAGATLAGTIAFGVGYAAASLACTFGVLLAVIAQAQATAAAAGVLVIFAAYTLGAAAVLLLVAVGTAFAGAAIGRWLTRVARHSARLGAGVLILTGGYLAWYWYPQVTDPGGPPARDPLGGWSAAASSWLGDHTVLVAAGASTLALASLAAALVPHWRRRLAHRIDRPTGNDRNSDTDHRPATTSARDGGPA